MPGPGESDRMPPHEAEIAVAGARLHVRIDGSDGKPWVVLINALATDLGLWEPQIAALAPRFRVLRYDIRGHGRSSAPPAPYAMETLVDDVLALADHFAIARAHFVGLSLGGIVATAAALRQPARAASLVVCDCRIEMPSEFVGAMDERNRLVRAQGMAALVAPMITRWFTPETLARMPQKAALVRAMIAQTAVEGFVGCSEAIKGARLLDRLGDLRLPTLFILGDRDAAVPIPVMREQQSRVPGARYAEIAAAGHLSNLEQPAAFNAALLPFLG